ncbi:MAG TPA: hypothetical protein VFT68_11560 [Lapillicoccus sp.]|nr:hypothetical protein [Lapillicoccus sp.]
MSNQGADYPQDQPYQQPPQPAYQQPPQPAYQQPYQQPYAPPGYATPGSDQVRFHAPGPALEHPQATLAFVLGLLSVLGLTILGPFGWYIGNKVVGEIDRDGREFANRGIAMAGKVLGIIGTVFLILSVLAFVAFIVFVVLAASTSS